MSHVYLVTEHGAVVAFNTAEGMVIGNSQGAAFRVEIEGVKQTFEIFLSKGSVSIKTYNKFIVIAVRGNDF